MSLSRAELIFDNFDSSPEPAVDDIRYLLETTGAERDVLFKYADKIRSRYCGDGILLRGLVEFTNICNNSCAYCGISGNNKSLKRYRMSRGEILEAAERIYRAGLRTIVLQGGEDKNMPAAFLADVICDIKRKYDMAVTLSAGERSFEDYRLWKHAGADRYLLKIETTDKKLYKKLHPEMSYERRMECLRFLSELDYQVGSGTLVGLAGNDTKSLAEDILFYHNKQFDMSGIGVFIPHKTTLMSKCPAGDINLALNMLAALRIVTGNCHLPATTAVGVAGTNEATIKALKAGANVIMPNFTPDKYRQNYEIYPGKFVAVEAEKVIKNLNQTAGRIGRYIDYSRGDSLKYKDTVKC
jgi:biotin synthase